MRLKMKKRVMPAHPRLQVFEVEDISPVKSKPVGSRMVLQIGAEAGAKVVKHRRLMPAAQKAINDMTCDEPRPTGHERFHPAS